MAAWQTSYEIRVSTPWPSDFAMVLDGIAPRERELITSVITWGREDGNRFDVYLEQGLPDGGLLRLDMRDWNPAFVQSIATCLGRWAALIVLPDGRALPPSAALITESAAASPAARFVDQPGAYLRRLVLGDHTDG